MISLPFRSKSADVAAEYEPSVFLVTNLYESSGCVVSAGVATTDALSLADFVTLVRVMAVGSATTFTSSF